MKTPVRVTKADSGALSIVPSGDTATTGMVYIPGGSCIMGADTDQADKDDYPKYEVKVKVKVKAFWIDRPK